MTTNSINWNYQSWEEAFKALVQAVRQQSVRVASYTQVLYAQACASSFSKQWKEGAIRISAKNVELAYKCALYHQIGKALLPPELQVWRNDFTAIAELAECQFPRNGNRYFENLTRLGLVEKSKNEWFFNQDRYDLIFNHPNFKKQYEFFNKPPAATNVECIKGVYEITEFCQSFFSVCLYDPSDDSEDDE